MPRRTLIYAFVMLIGRAALTADFAIADEPTPRPRYSYCAYYFYDAERTQIAGSRCMDCDGEVSSIGVTTEYEVWGQAPCD